MADTVDERVAERSEPDSPDGTDTSAATQVVVPCASERAEKLARHAKVSQATGYGGVLILLFFVIDLAVSLTGRDVLTRMIRNPEEAILVLLWAGAPALLGVLAVAYGISGARRENLINRRKAFIGLVLGILCLMGLSWLSWMFLLSVYTGQL